MIKDSAIALLHLVVYIQINSYSGPGPVFMDWTTGVIDIQVSRGLLAWLALGGIVLTAGVWINSLH